jgi:4'-phosphopantetheinyl transferase
MSRFADSAGFAPLPGEDEVHVWKIVLKVGGTDDRWLLSEDERARADRFRMEGDRDTFICARAAMRRILGACMEKDPATIEFRYEPRGKPYMTGRSPLQFSLSHSGRLALLAVARSARVGIDLERIRFLDDPGALANRHFSRREVSVWRSLPERDRLAGFHRLWTQKEAFVKATGDGLAFPLRDFEVLLRPEGAARVHDLRVNADFPGEWSFHGFEPGPGYAATLAVEAPCATVRYFSTSPSRPVDVSRLLTKPEQVPRERYAG